MRTCLASRLSIATLLAAPAPASAASVALVLAVDVSDSVTAERYKLQHDGIAAAFENPRLIGAIAALPGGIEALVLEWSDPEKIAVTVDWTKIADPPSAAGFAAALRASTRSSHGLTAIGAALQAAGAALDRLPEPADRSVIDVSGDGIANFGPPPAEMRDRLVAGGATINGLAILTVEPWLTAYYEQNVIGGAGAFCLVADSMDSFAEAMLKKLVQEVAEMKTPLPRAGEGEKTRQMQ